MGAIAAIIVWAFIEAICNKNVTPLLILGVLYLIISVFAEIMY